MILCGGIVLSSTESEYQRYRYQPSTHAHWYTHSLTISLHMSRYCRAICRHQSIRWFPLTSSRHHCVSLSLSLSFSLVSLSLSLSLSLLPLSLVSLSLSLSPSLPLSPSGGKGLEFNQRFPCNHNCPAATTAVRERAQSNNSPCSRFQCA